MFDPFKFLKQQMSPHYLGVDIGTTSVKIVEVDQGKQLTRILNYALLESQSSLSRANVALQTSSLKLFEEETADLLQSALKKMKPRTKEAVASLPVFSAFTTVLSFPEMSAADLQKTLAYQAKQYIPLPISEVAMDWLKVGSYEDDKGFKFQQVLLISVPQEQIKKYQQIFRKAGLSLGALEIEGLSLVRSLIGSDPTPTMILRSDLRAPGADQEVSANIPEGGTVAGSARDRGAFAGPLAHRQRSHSDHDPRHRQPVHLHNRGGQGRTAVQFPERLRRRVPYPGGIIRLEHQSAAGGGNEEGAGHLGKRAELRVIHNNVAVSGCYH